MPPPTYFDPWPHPRGFHLIAISTSLEAPTSTYGPFRMDKWGLAWVVSGGGTTYYDNEAVKTGPGTVLFVHPEIVVRHDWGPARAQQTFVVFGFDELPAPWPSFEEWPRFRHFPDNHFLFVLWRYLLSFDLNNPQTLSITVPIVELMLRIYATEASGEIAPLEVVLPEQVERCVRLIHEHMTSDPSKPLRLAELAKKSHVTPQHLCRLFKETIGLGPIECAHSLRLELASGLIERTELSIGQIADRFGYSSQFYFSKVFKQSYGMSPTEYRKAFRTGKATRPTGLMFKHHALRRYFYEETPGRIRTF